MADFKEQINAETVRKLSYVLAESERRQFLNKAQALNSLELKERARYLAHELFHSHQSNFKKLQPTLKTLLKKKELKQFEWLIVSECLSLYGTESYKNCWPLLLSLTENFTAEFAIRDFLEKDFSEVIVELERLIQSSNVHHRRLVSEGTRPSLPWGQQISHLKQNPLVTLPLLAQLKNDPELYVRKSVANHLNDISKTHPKEVIQFLKSNRRENDDWLIHHALRTLIKRGEPAALKMIGIELKPKVQITYFALSKKTFTTDESLQFTVQIKSLGHKAQSCLLDYTIFWLKKNGELSPKTYKGRRFNLEAGETKSITKKHSLKPITTMVHYPGQQELHLQLNGTLIQKVTWKLRS